MEVKAHYKNVGGADTIELWRRMSEDIGLGDSFTVTAGCNKQFETCRLKFANGNNFRGLPHMPGNDYVTRNPTGDTGNDGGSRYSCERPFPLHRYRRAGTRLDRHALPSPGQREGCRLRLSRADARAFSRALRL